MHPNARLRVSWRRLFILSISEGQPVGVRICKDETPQAEVLLEIHRAGSGCRGGALPPGVWSSAVLLNMARVM